MTTAGNSRRVRVVPWVALAIILVGGFLYWRMRPRAPAGLPSGVEVATVEQGTQQQKITASGVVASQVGTQLKIGSQVTGRIRQLPADVGTLVQAGQVVAVLDSPDLQAQVEEQRNTVAVAEASLAQSRSRYEQAVESAGYTSEQTVAQIAEANAALQVARAKVDSSAASAQLQPIQTSADIRRAQATLSSANSAKKQVEQTVRQQVQQAQSNLDDAQVGADNAKRTLGRQQQLFKKGFIAAELVDQLGATYNQALARVENMKAGLDIAREKTRADLQAAQDQVAQAEAGLAAAQAEKFQDTLHEADLHGTREALVQALATLRLQKANRRQDRVKQMAIDEARNAVLQGQASVLQARSQLRYELAQLDKTIIRSPISGTVLSLTAQQGETIAAGLAAPTLITVADLNRLEVRAYVDETDIGRIRSGLPAEVRVESFPTRVFRGRVTKIASASTIKDNVVTYETTVAVSNPGGALRPDMTADVSLILGEHPNVLLVPSEAVHRETTRSLVYVLHPDKQGADQVEVRKVEVGFDDGGRTSIRAGLRKGESVVVAGLPLLGVHAPDAQGGTPGK